MCMYLSTRSRSSIVRVSVGDGGSCIVYALWLLEPASLLYTVYLETFPLGCNGGNQETNMLSAVKASALIPAGGPGTVKRTRRESLSRKSFTILQSYNLIVQDN